MGDAPTNIVVCRVAEFLLTLLCAAVTIHYSATGGGEAVKTLILNGTFFGFIFVTFYFICAALMKETLANKSVLILLFVAIVFFITSAALLINLTTGTITVAGFTLTREMPSWAIAVVIMAFLNVAVFATDLFFTFRASKNLPN